MQILELRKECERLAGWSFGAGLFCGAAVHYLYDAAGADVLAVNLSGSLISLIGMIAFKALCSAGFSRRGAERSSAVFMCALATLPDFKTSPSYRPLFMALVTFSFLLKNQLWR